MTGFIGSYSHSLDAKGRLVIPSGFREKLGEQFCLAPSFDFQSIAVYPTEMWEKRSETYEKLGHLNPALNRYLEQFYALSYSEQSCDGQGQSSGTRKMSRSPARMIISASRPARTARRSGHSSDRNCQICWS